MTSTRLFFRDAENSWRDTDVRIASWSMFQRVYDAKASNQKVDSRLEHLSLKVIWFAENRFNFNKYYCFFAVFDVRK